MIESDTPNLWELRRYTNHATTVGIVVIALTHTARLVNVENNLNETQIGEIANDIIEDFGYLKVEEIKHVLKTAVRTKKIFGRLDYNVVMEWFEEYAIERTDEAISISNCKEAKENLLSPDAITFDVYMARLWDIAYYADPEAVEKLAEMTDRTSSRLTLLTEEEKHRKNVEFKQYYYNNYLKGKK